MAEADISPNSAAGVNGAELIDYHLARQNAAQAYNADMAKWILASLILINGGPFLLLSKDIKNYAVALQAAAGWFVAGLALAVLCGFLAWLNTGMREAVGGYTVKRLIADNGATPGRAEIVSGRVVAVSYLFSILTGFGALATFLIGAFTLAAVFRG